MRTRGRSGVHERARNFVRRHRPTVSLRPLRRTDPAARLIVRPIAYRRSAFDLIESHDVDYRPYSAAEDFRSANVAVIPMHTSHLGWVRARVPWVVWKLASAGRLALVFDSSGEGASHRPRFSADLHALLTEKRVAFERCLLLTQNRTYGADYRAYCEASGIGHGMHIHEYDYFISRFFRDFAERGGGVFQRRLMQFESRAAERERCFFSLNRIPRPHRLFFLLSLIRDGLFERGFVSFAGFGNPSVPQQLRFSKKDAAGLLAREQGFEDLAHALRGLLPQLAAMGEVFVGDGNFETAQRLAADLDTDLYDRTWMSVVTETEMTERPIRITEKPLRPLVNFHPMLVFGNPGALAELRAFGFETFGAAIDESYDEETDPRRRFDLAYREVRRLCGLEPAELCKLESRLRDVLIGNARHGLLEMPTIYRDRLNRVLIDKVKAVAAG